MPDYTLLVVPKGTVLEETVETKIGFDAGKEDLPGVQVAKDLLDHVEWDCYALLSDEWVHDELDPAPEAPWSVMLWQYVDDDGAGGGDFVYCRVRKAGEEGDVIFAGTEYGDVLLQTGGNFMVDERALNSIRNCTRLVAEIRTGAPSVSEAARQWGPG